MLKFNDRNNWLDLRINEVLTSYHIPSNIEANDICVDVGGNVGAFAIVNSHKFKRIIAIEPSEYSCNEYRNNMAKRLITNVEVHRLAVSDISNKVLHLKPWLLDNESGNASTIISEKWNDDIFEEVLSISLEDMFKNFNLKKINYLKVDCEGGEYDFLMNKDLYNIDYLAIEIHSHIGEKAIELLDYIKKHFDVLILTGNGVSTHIGGTFKNKKI